jgi:hypothetical protein
LLSLASYAPQRQCYLSARGKLFPVTLLGVLESGSDWCLAEVSLNQSLDSLPDSA